MRWQWQPSATNRDMAHPGARRDHRASGFTLFEVLLVLTLVVVMSSLVAPLLQNSLASFRLRSSTDSVIAAWSKIRARAIETGHVYQFRFIEDDSKYRVERWYTDNRNSQRDQDEEQGEEGNEQQSSDELRQDEDDNWHYEESLSEGVKFHGGDQSTIDEEGEKLVESLEGEGADDWSTPILFFPDGTTSTVSIVLRNDLNQFQRTTLRSLTGVARASQLLSETEAQGANSR
ncbi:MAG: hypothetical protein GXP26_06960 [Planctomycetes bacterium]|nr:hypothetical protein [Planctomycetota bacterium]